MLYEVSQNLPQKPDIMNKKSKLSKTVHSKDELLNLQKFTENSTEDIENNQLQKSRKQKSSNPALKSTWTQKILPKILDCTDKNQHT